MPRSMQASFVAGEIAPSLHARTDLDQYLRGAALVRNCFVRVFGGLANRAGSHFLDYTHSDAVARLIPFRFDDEQQYALEFTQNTMRWFLGTGQLICQASTATIASSTVGAGPAKWNNISTGGASVVSVTDGINLVGAVGGVALAEQPVVNATPGAELVLKFFALHQVGIRIGTTSGAEDLLASRQLTAGFHNVAFTPPSATFYVRVGHTNPDTRTISNFSFNNPVSGSAVPMTMGHQYLAGQLPQLTWTQKADVLTICHPEHPPYDLRRYGALSWSLERRPFAPSLAAPLTADVSSSVVGTPAIDYYYQVTYQADSGEESLPCPFISVNGPATLNYTDHVRITLAQPYPTGVRRALVYKFRGGVWGFLGQLPEGQPNFDDDGSILPKIDQTPPGDRNPFNEPDSYPAAVTYWEQRLVMAGTNAAPDTVEMSRPGAFFNFSRSSPTRDDDSITFTPAGNLVRRIKHLVGAKALYIFTDSAVLAARRGDAGVTPAMEGGVAVELAKGSTAVPPTQVGESVLFVTSAGRSLYSISDRASTEGFVGQEVSLLSEHLLNASRVVDAAWCEVPHSLLWLIRADGKMASVSYLDRQQVFGWALHDTQGHYENCCAARSEGLDYLYTVVRRRLNGSWRRCVERSGPRTFASIKDAFFVDCGLTLDNPVAITAVGLGEPVTITAPGHGLIVGDLVDVDDSGVPQLDGRRFKVVDLADSTTERGIRIRVRFINGTRPANYAAQVDELIAAMQLAFMRVSIFDELDVTLASSFNTVTGGDVITPPSAEHVALYNAVKGDAPATDIFLCFVPQCVQADGVTFLRGFSCSTMPCAVSSNTATNYTAAHEICHCFGLEHVASTDNLLFNNTGLITNLPPDLTAGQIATIAASGLVVDIGDAAIMTLGNQFTGAEFSGAEFTPWLEGGVVRKAVRNVSGLGHLEGMTVVGLGDGSVFGPLTVTSGAITLQKAASRIHIGLPYVSDIKTLNIAEPPDGYGTRKRVVEVQAFVNESRGLLAGPGFDDLYEPPGRSTERWSEPTRTKSELIKIPIKAEWGTGGQVCFRQDKPLPVELLAVVPVFERSSG